MKTANTSDWIGSWGQQKAVCEGIRTKSKIPLSGREAAEIKEPVRSIEKASFRCHVTGSGCPRSSLTHIVSFWANVICRIIGIASPE